MDIGTLRLLLEARDMASTVVNNVGTAMRTLDKDAGTLKASLESFGQATSRAGGALSIGVTAPLVAASGAALLLSGNFEASMTRLVSLAGVSKDELAGVKQHILDLAPAVGIGPQALADAMTKVSSTVSDTNVAMSILDMSAKGSAAGMGSALDVAGALTAVVNSYGAGNITAARAADILTKAVQDGGAEAKELAPTLAGVVPIAAQMGISFEEVGANIATLTKLGVPASEAVTQLTSVMTAMLKETPKGAEALRSVGLSYDAVRKAIREDGLAAAMTDLTERFGDNKTGLTQVFGRIEALRNVMGTAGQQTATYAEEVKRMTTSVGSLDQAFDAMKGTQLQTWGEVSAALQVAAIRFGDALAPAMGQVLEAVKPLLAGLTQMANWFAELPAPIQTAAIVLGGLAAAVGPLLLLIGGMASGVAALIPVFGAGSVGLGLLTGAFTLLTGPIGLTVAAAAAAYLALSHFGLLTPIVNFFKDVGSVIAGVVVAAFHLVAPLVTSVAASIGGALLTALTTITAPLTSVAGWVKSLATAFLDGLVPVLKTAREYLGFVADKFREIDLPVAAANKGVSTFSKGMQDVHAPTMSTKDALALLNAQLGIHAPATALSAEQTKKAAAEAKKHADALADVNEKIADATRDVGHLTAAQETSIKTLRDLGLTNSDIAVKLGVSELAIKRVESAWKFADAAAGATDKTFGHLAMVTIPDLSGRMAAFRDDLETLASTSDRFHGGVTAAGDALDHVLIPAFSTLPNVAAGATQAIKDAKDATIVLGDSVKGGLSDALARIPGLLKQAFTGGGDLLGAAKAIGVDIANSILTPIVNGLKTAGQLAKAASVSGAASGAAIGAAGVIAGQSWSTALGQVGMAAAGVAVATGVATAAAISAGTAVAGASAASAALIAGAWTMGIGAAAVGVALLVKYWLSVKQEEKDARAEFEAYQKQFGTLDDMIKTVGEAYAITGRSGAEAEAALRTALDATHHSAQDVHAALLNINAVMEEARAKVLAYKAVDDALGHLLETVKTVDVGLPEAFRPMVERMLAMPGLTENVKASLQGLVDNATPNFAKLESMAKGYGIELSGLGPAFQQAHVTDEAKKILTDFDSLIAAGADVNGVIRGMGDEVSKVVQESIKFGSEIPENMRPMIQALLDSGQLLDENKQVITDISALKFGAAVKTDVDKLADAITQLSEAIGKIPGVVDHARIATQTGAQKMVEDWNGVEDAVNALNFGHSPGGLKEIPIKAAQAVMATAAMKAYMVDDMGVIEDHIFDVGVAIQDWIDPIDSVRRAIGDLSGDMRTLNVDISDAMLAAEKAAEHAAWTAKQAAENPGDAGAAAAAAMAAAAAKAAAAAAAAAGGATTGGVDPKVSEAGALAKKNAGYNATIAKTFVSQFDPGVWIDAKGHYWTGDSATGRLVDVASSAAEAVKALGIGGAVQQAYLPTYGMADGGYGRATGPTMFYTNGDEDFAFSGEGRGFGSGGAGGDMRKQNELIADNTREVAQMRHELEQSRRSLPHVLAGVMKTAILNR